MRKSFVPLVVAFLASGAVLLSGEFSVPLAAEAASSSSGQGTTTTTIRVGVPYVDLSAVRKFGTTLDHGNYPDAYDALIANINAHGGVDGRKLVPFLVAVNPVGTAPAATTCTQLAQDDHVFVALAPEQPDCYLTQYDVPTINGSAQNVSGTSTPNFTLTPPPWPTTRCSCRCWTATASSRARRLVSSPAKSPTKRSSKSCSPHSRSCM